MSSFRLASRPRRRPYLLIAFAVALAAAGATSADDFGLSVAGGTANGRIDCVDDFPCDHRSGYLKLAAAYRGIDPLEFQLAYFHVGDLKGADTTPLDTRFGGTFKLSGIAATPRAPRETRRRDRNRHARLEPGLQRRGRRRRRQRRAVHRQRPSCRRRTERDAVLHRPVRAGAQPGQRDDGPAQRIDVQRGATDGPRTTARFQSPNQAVLAPDGSLYVIDYSVITTSSSLRRIAADGTVSTVPGGTNVIGVAVDPNGTLYVAQQQAFSQTLGVPDPASGVFTPIIGTGTAVVLGDVSPSLGPQIGSIASHGTKQIAVVSGNQLLLVTLP